MKSVMKSTSAILAIGDVSWDDDGEARSLGGDAAAFAARLAALNRTVDIATVVSDDADGKDALHRLEQMGLGVSLVQRHASPLPEGPLFAQLGAQPELFERADDFEVLYFSSRLQRFPTSRDTLQKFLAASPPSFKVYDIFCGDAVPSLSTLEEGLGVASVAHLRRSEISSLCSVLGLPVMEPGLLSSTIPERFGVSYCVITDPREGVAVTSIVGEQIVVTPRMSEFVDLRGWEEAFLAAFVHHVMKGSALERCSVAGMHYADLSARGGGYLRPCSKEELAAIRE